MCSTIDHLLQCCVLFPLCILKFDKVRVVSTSTPCEKLVTLKNIGRPGQELYVDVQLAVQCCLMLLG